MGFFQFASENPKLTVVLAIVLTICIVEVLKVLRSKPRLARKMHCPNCGHVLDAAVEQPAEKTGQ